MRFFEETVRSSSKATGVRFQAWGFPVAILLKPAHSLAI